MSHEPTVQWQYEFRVERQLGPGVAALFPELTLAYDQQETVMRGALPDQAALHGVLMRIRDLGLTLVALQRVADGVAPAAAGDRRDDGETTTIRDGGP
ncbi:MAG: hypothetical protein HGA45_03050 [Chloroflexales bacterium]|nr:hypothetical protein [Chloroflexales bacterium]